MSKDLVRRGIWNTFDKVFNETFEDMFDTSLTPFKDKFSNMEVVEGEKDINVSLELPGVDIKDIDVSVDNHSNLTIKGEKKSENTDEKDGKVVRTERYYGSFERTVSLGSNVDPNNIEAVYKDGVLKLTIPKIEIDNTIKIKVKQ